MDRVQDLAVGLLISVVLDVRRSLYVRERALFRQDRPQVPGHHYLHHPSLVPQFTLVPVDPHRSLLRVDQGTTQAQCAGVEKEEEEEVEW